MELILIFILLLEHMLRNILDILLNPDFDRFTRPSNPSYSIANESLKSLKIMNSHKVNSELIQKSSRKIGRTKRETFGLSLKRNKKQKK